MNAVIFYVVPSFRLTGSTINAIEYFLAGYEHNKDLKLVLINSTNNFKRKMQILIRDRYLINDIDMYHDNIVCIRKSMLPTLRYDTILVLDYVTIANTMGLLNAKKILVISEKYMEKYFYKKSLYNVEYYGEMPFHYKDHEYRMKCLFNRYKPLKDVQSGTYVNSPKNDKHVYQIIDSFLHLPKPFIFKSKTKPEENLFENFTNYLYYHADKWFDPHPRLFLECRHYNKPITYYNPHNIKDGSWYRWEDLNKNGLYDRTLDKNDEIIRELTYGNFNYS